MNTLPVLLGALCVYALAYRYYSAFIAAKALALDDRRTTPAHTFTPTDITMSRHRGGCCSDITSRPLPEPALWWDRPWRRNSDLLRGFFGC